MSHVTSVYKSDSVVIIGCRLDFLIIYPLYIYESLIGSYNHKLGKLYRKLNRNLPQISIFNHKAIMLRIQDLLNKQFRLTSAKYINLHFINFFSFKYAHSLHDLIYMLWCDAIDTFQMRKYNYLDVCQSY